MGVILAGGEARRFRVDKLFYEVNSKPIVLYTIENMEKVRWIDRIVVVARRTNYSYFEDWGFDVIVDDYLVGPIGAIFLALLHYNEIFVLAGDMPLVKPKLIDEIIKEYRESSCATLVLGYKDYLEPLVGVYSRRILDYLENAILRKEYSLQKLLRRLNPCIIKISESQKSILLNINTKKDVDTFTRLIGSNLS